MAVLITGVSGQDGSYLAEQLLAAGEQVTGVIHPHEPLPEYAVQLQGREGCELVQCDLSEPADFRHLLREWKPDKVYHLAAISSPQQCEQLVDISRKLNVASVEVLADWLLKDSPRSRALVPSSAAIFGNAAASPHNEATPCQPVNEYGRQKLQVRQIAEQACKAGAFLACAIAFNHESPRRPEDFVIAKIIHSAARIALGQQQELRLGNTAAVRDWGYAAEYMTAYAWMLDIDKPTDLVIATGKGHSVAEAAELAFQLAGLHAADHVLSDQGGRVVDDPLVSVGDPSRAWQELGWEARLDFQGLLQLLLDHALAQHRNT